MTKHFQTVILGMMIAVFSITITAHAQGNVQELVDIVQNKEAPITERVVALDKLRRIDRPALSAHAVRGDFWRRRTIRGPRCGATSQADCADRGS